MPEGARQPSCQRPGTATGMESRRPGPVRRAGRPDVMHAAGAAPAAFAHRKGAARAPPGPAAATPRNPDRPSACCWSYPEEPWRTAFLRRPCNQHTEGGAAYFTSISMYTSVSDTRTPLVAVFMKVLLAGLPVPNDDVGSSLKVTRYRPAVEPVVAGSQMKP